MVRAENRAAARAQTLPDRNVLARIDFVLDLAFPDVVGADIFVDQVVLPCEKTAALERKHVAGVPDHSVQHVERDLHRHFEPRIGAPPGF